MTAVTMTLDELPETALLAEALCDAQNHVLLAAGTALTATVIAGLRRRGIERLSALLPEPAVEAVPPEEPMAKRERIERRLQHLFRHTLSSGQLNPLLHMLPAYRFEDPA